MKCLILCLLAIIQTSSSINLECSFNTNFNYPVMGRIYRCEIQNNFQGVSQNDSVVSSVSGQHQANAGHNDVNGIFAFSKNFKFMLKNVQNKFKNIKLIDFNNNKIQKIHQDDLKPYPKLVYCGFKDNEIETLENGLFDYNLELKLVSFWNNKITQVGPKVFNHLTKLSWLYFDGNPCIDMRVEDNRTGVLKMIKEISQNCNKLNRLDSIESTGLDKEVEEFKAQMKDLKTAHEVEFIALNKTVYELEKKNENLKIDLDEAKTKSNKLETKLSQIEENLRKMENDARKKLEGDLTAEKNKTKNLELKIEKIQNDSIEKEKWRNKVDDKLNQIFQKLNSFGQILQNKETQQASNKNQTQSQSKSI